MEWIIPIGLIVLMCVLLWWVYCEGKHSGRHVERMRLLDIMQSVPMDGLSSEKQFGVLCVVNYVVMKLREE